MVEVVDAEMMELQERRASRGSGSRRALLAEEAGLALVRYAPMVLEGVCTSKPERSLDIGRAANSLLRTCTKYYRIWHNRCC